MPEGSKHYLISVAVHCTAYLSLLGGHGVCFLFLVFSRSSIRPSGVWRSGRLEDTIVGWKGLVDFRTKFVSGFSWRSIVCGWFGDSSIGIGIGGGHCVEGDGTMETERL